ncbi:hypothetical protein [Pseudomonas aeruginosa]|uniref:hypothetical protein n=1 Tax=Pseudomonas aeruginosa TaxID=287 RepID=UPI0039EA38C2
MPRLHDKLIGASLAGGEPLVIRRRLEGVHTGPTPIEINQKLVHCLDIHYVEERKAYCRLNGDGDIEDVIRILTLAIPDQIEGREVVTILRKDLDNYMALADLALVLKFDFTRYVPGSFDSWHGATRYHRDESDLFFHGGSISRASFAHGAMVVRPKTTVEEQEEVWRKDFDGDPDREYAVFKIYDRKNDRQVETSCSPDHIVSYFEDSDLPWQISPAFFRAEVLNRFKGDPEKYTLEDRSISCRGAWTLKSYDINEAGQVHAWIWDLSKLPFDEQLYWKAFNEWPKAPISERANRTDIEGDWYTEYQPLDALKRKVRELDKRKPVWWNPRGEELIDSVLAPATDSPKEWGDEIMALDQCLVEGFLDKPLRKVAEGKGCVLESTWRSLKLLYEILVASSISAEEARKILAPMRKLHELRNEIRGHATHEKKVVAIREARTTHGNFRAQFFHLAEGCDKALVAVLEAMDFELGE